MVSWILTIVISVALLAYTAAGRSESLTMAYYNMALAAVFSLVFVGLALRSNSALRASGASQSALAADTARSMSLIWFWGVVGLAVIYGTGILAWKEWWHFLLAFAAVGAICFFSHVRLQRQADTGADDAALLKQGRIGTIVQLVGMVLVVVGLLVDGKMVRFFVERYTDWAANNIFFFGSAAIGAICVYALATQKQSTAD